MLRNNLLSLSSRFSGGVQAVSGGGRRYAGGAGGSGERASLGTAGLPQSVQDALNKSPIQREQMRKMEEESDPNVMKDKFMQSAHTELGLTKEEFEARKIKAAAPYKVKSKKGDYEFDVTSSARVQQIMTQGTADRAARKAKERIEEEGKKLWGLQIMFAGVAVVFALFLWVSYAKPVIEARTKRARMQERRYKEIFLPAVEREQARRREMQMLQGGDQPQQQGQPGEQQGQQQPQH